MTRTSQGALKTFRFPKFWTVIAKALNKNCHERVRSITYSSCKIPSRFFWLRRCLFCGWFCHVAAGKKPQMRSYYIYCKSVVLNREVHVPLGGTKHQKFQGYTPCKFKPDFLNIHRSSVECVPLFIDCWLGLSWNWFVMRFEYLACLYRRSAVA